MSNLLQNRKNMSKNHVEQEDTKSEKRKTQTKFSKVKELQAQTNQYNEKNQKLASKEDELLLIIKNKEKEIQEIRDKIVRKELNHNSKTPESCLKELKTRENHLQKKIVQYSTTNSENIAISDKIDALRQEIDTFKDILSKLESELNLEVKKLLKKSVKFQEKRNENAELQVKVNNFKILREQEHNNFTRGFHTMHNVLRQSNLQATFQVRQSSTTIRKNRGVWGNTTSEYYDSAGNMQNQGPQKYKKYFIIAED